jgi:hypothetical protein
VISDIVINLLNFAMNLLDYLIILSCALRYFREIYVGYFLQRLHNVGAYCCAAPHSLRDPDTGTGIISFGGGPGSAMGGKKPTRLRDGVCKSSQARPANIFK